MSCQISNAVSSNDRNEDGLNILLIFAGKTPPFSVFTATLLRFIVTLDIIMVLYTVIVSSYPPFTYTLIVRKRIVIDHFFCLLLYVHSIQYIVEFAGKH